MNRGADAVRSLHLEFMAHRVEVRIEPDPKKTGDVMDYGTLMDRLHILSAAHASSMARRILDNENDPVRLLVNERDLDLRAIRKESNHG